MRTKLTASILLAALACAPASTTFSPPLAPGVDPSARNLLGPATPGSNVPLSSADQRWVDNTLASLTLRQKVGQLIMPWVGGDYAAVGSAEFEEVRKWVEDDQVGALVLSIGMPLSYAAKLNELQTRAKVPLLIASDMENGPGMRLGNIYALPSLLPQGGGTVFPPVMALGATGSEELAFKLGQVLGSEARAIGVHMAFGPVLDVNSNPLNPIINTRSFGENPALVSRLAQAYIRGARSMGLMTTGKHFPGHGDTDVDSHLELPTIRADRAQLDSIDLPPFRAAVAENIDAIMTAHIAFPALLGDSSTPATLSRRAMTDLLRRELGFTGLLVTDALDMNGVLANVRSNRPGQVISGEYGTVNSIGLGEAIKLAVEAGADVLFAPGLNTADEARTVCGSLDRPFNIMRGPRKEMLSVAQLAELGVKRVSLGGLLQAAAMHGFIAAAREVANSGTFEFAKAIPFAAEIDTLLTKGAAT